MRTSHPSSLFLLKKGTRRRRRRRRRRNEEEEEEEENKKKEVTAYPRVNEITLGNRKYVAPNDYYDNESEYDDLPIPFTHISDHDLDEHAAFDIENLFGTDYEINDDSIIHVPLNVDIESSKLGDAVLEDPVFETSTFSENDDITYSGLLERDIFDLFLPEFDKPWVIHLRETCCCSTNLCSWRPNTVYKNRSSRRHHRPARSFLPPPSSAWAAAPAHHRAKTTLLALARARDSRQNLYTDQVGGYRELLYADRVGRYGAPHTLRPGGCNWVAAH
ncbi:hypothetical protein QYE76_065971 [Lolium multiflorum]|uniref:Uncharacterized protein n=1 Tax=Lolium multiflorum TaxID=4521 RepID=A0AAD8W9A0_LOLMU|nr:hypothetical protein QYE76_065971 [Lolium multiflorum]